MRHRGNVDNLGDHDASIVDGTDGALTTGTRALHIALHLTETGVKGGLGRIFCGHLGGVRGVLLGTAEAALAGGGPADHLTLGVAQGHDDVVEGRGDMGFAISFNLDNSFLGSCSFLGLN